MAAVVLTAAIADCRTGKIPNRLTYPLILGGLVFWLAAGVSLGGMAQGKALLGASTTGMLAALLPYALLVLTLGLGGGDMKLMAAVGAWSASWQVVLSTTVYALLVAVAMALFIMVRHRLTKRTLGRLLSAALLAGSRVRADIPQDSPQVPFAVAIAVGSLLAGSEQMLGLITPWAAYNP